MTLAIGIGRLSSVRLFILLLLVSSCYQDSGAFKIKRNKPKLWNKMNNKFIKSFVRSIKNNPARVVPSSSRQDVNVSPEAYMTSAEIIQTRGYPLQTYSVMTVDGYILGVHRIPHGKGQSVDSGPGTGTPVLLQHGFIDSDTAWVIASSERSLAFRLADLGYDVWLGNSRGNTYSRRHTTLDTSSEAFWNFSYDEMGKYDIPALINFILATTGRSSLSFVGHSMGCAMFFIAMIYHPELNAKIDVMIALGPAASLANMKSPLRYLTPYVRPIEAVLRLFQTREFLRQDALIPIIQRRFCSPTGHWEGFCRNVLFATVGDDSYSLPLEVLTVIQNHMPAGTSVRTTAQLADNRNSGETFIPYNYGWLGNLRRYGRFNPPPYDLSRVTCPVYLFYGPNDLLVVPEDVEWLAAQLPNVRGSIKVDYSLYNHFDFLYATDNNPLVYNQLISYLPSANSTR